MKRALRRHHKERMKRWAKRIVSVIWKSVEPPERFMKNADHLKNCSCEMCCNPRRSGWRKSQGKTRKEIQVETDLREALN